MGWEIKRLWLIGLWESPKFSHKVESSILFKCKWDKLRPRVNLFNHNFSKVVDLFLNDLNNTNWRVSFKLWANKLLFSLPVTSWWCWKPFQSPQQSCARSKNRELQNSWPKSSLTSVSAPQQLPIFSKQHLTYFQLNDFELRKGKKLGVTISFNNHRLFVGNIPKNRDTDELLEEFSKHARE